MQVTRFVPTGKVLPEGGAQLVTATAQLSVAETLHATLLRLHWPGLASSARLAGQMTTGGWVSRTVTVKAQALVLPLASVATQRTVLVPTANVEPDGGTQLVETTRSLSVAETFHVTLARLHWPESASSAMFAGQVMTGPSRSITVTLNEQVFVPSVFVAVQVTVVVPRLNRLPLAGAQETSGLGVPVMVGGG